MMEPTTGETSVLEALDAPAQVAPKKSSQTFFGLLFSTYKIPVFSLILFGSFTMRALYPEKFHFGFKRAKTYRFKAESLGFFIGDVSFFNNNAIEEAERQVIQLFPDKLQKKVNRIIRPVMILCEKHQLDPFWVLSVMWTESHFKLESTSKRGAVGLMQVMPQTYMEILAEMKKKGMILEADQGPEYMRYNYPEAYKALGHTKMVSKLRNLEVGIYYLKGLLERFNNNHHYATVAYNMGPSWTKGQLKNNLPVGQNNQYLSKVLKAYYHMTKTLSQNTDVAFIPRI
jgi:Transglycosylase SLT domain